MKCCRITSCVHLKQHLPTIVEQKRKEKSMGIESISYILLMIILLVNVTGFILVHVAKREYVNCIAEDNGYIPSSTLICLDTLLVALSSLGGWFTIYFTAVFVRYKEVSKRSSFYIRMKTAGVINIIVLASAITTIAFI